MPFSFHSTVEEPRRAQSTEQTHSSSPRRRLPRRLSVRVPLLTGLVVVVVIAVVGAALATVLYRFLIRQVDEDLAANLSHGSRSAQELVDLARRTGPGGRQDPSPAPGQGRRQGPGPGAGMGRGAGGGAWGALQIEQKDGSVTSGIILKGYDAIPLPSGQLATLEQARNAALSDGLSDRGPRRNSLRVSQITLDEYGTYRVATEYWVSTGGDWQRLNNPSQIKSSLAQNPSEVLAVTVGLPLAPTRAVITNFLLNGMIIALFGAVLAIGVVYLVMRRELRPLRRVAETAREVTTLDLSFGARQLDKRVSLTDTDPASEAGEVGQALNTMLDHVSEALTVREESESQVRQFVADASHELRTPLTAVLGYADLLSRLEASPEQTQALARLRSESNRMKELVEDLLLLARLDAGRPLDLRAIDLTQLVVESVSDAHVSDNSHQWVLNLPDPADLTVKGDDLRLRQVIGNLLANARQHTPEGTTVTVSVSRRPTPGANDQTHPAVVCQVSDNGPGIAPEIRATIFDRFARADSARAAGASTGLGLSIARAITEAHGGTLNLLDADPDRPGTTFELCLPAVPAPSQTPSP